MPRKPRPAAAPPDLHSQLEGLLGEVWRGEADWRLMDRIDMALGQPPPRRRVPRDRPWKPPPACS